MEIKKLKNTICTDADLFGKDQPRNVSPVRPEPVLEQRSQNLNFPDLSHSKHGTHHK